MGMMSKEYHEGYQQGFKDVTKADYENRLKADLVVVLEDLLEEFEKLDPDYECNTYYAAIRDCSNLTQQKIDKLREGEL